MQGRASILGFYLAMSISPVSSQSLPDIARHQGGSAETLIDIDSPIARLPDLMLRSDLVIHGRIVDVKTRLDSDQSNVVTECTITPTQAFQDRRSTSVATPGAISKVVVQRSGGRLVTGDGLRLSTSVNIYPESEVFIVGEAVVVFLTYHADTGTYYFTGGEFGAYRIRDGMVTSMTRSVAARRGDTSVAAPVFFQTLQRLR